MDKYYYLIASLPLLKFIELPSQTREDFLAQAEKWLSTEDFILLNRVDINNFFLDQKDTSTLKKWKGFERSIREELAAFRRARRKNIEYKIRRDLIGIIQENNNPLEIERELLLLRWSFLEELEIEHFFDLDFLIIYHLKLQLLERLASFNKEKGKERFEVFSKVEL